MFAFPGLVLAIVISGLLGPSIQNSMLALLLVWWPPYARLARGHE
jgi:peptide/nickel transport system permease protein